MDMFVHSHFGAHGAPYGDVLQRALSALKKLRDPCHAFL